MTKRKTAAHPPGWITITQGALILKEGYQLVRDRYLRGECGVTKYEGRTLLAQRDNVMARKRTLDAEQRTEGTTLRRKVP